MKIILRLLLNAILALAVAGLMLLPTPAHAAPAYKAGRPYAVTAVTVPVFASSGPTGTCSILFINDQSAVKLHLTLAPEGMTDAGIDTTALSFTVCSAAGGCTYTNYAQVPAGNGVVAYRSASGALPIIIIYAVCNG